MKGRYSERAPIYAGLLGAGLVAAIVTFTIALNSASSGAVQQPSTTEGQTSAPTDAYTPDYETSEEMKDAAIELLSGNYEVLCLFYTRGLEHEAEPYGNAPEDGYYTVDSEEYTSMEQLEQLVNSIFVEEQAKITMENSLGYGPIYQERYNGALGIIENFTPMEYDISWENPDFSIEPISDEDCILRVIIHDRASGEEITREGEMVKTDEGWKLNTIIF